ncbi:MAG: alkaline phosphatase family protein [Terriglobales bacterium]
MPRNAQFVYMNPPEAKPYFLLAERYTFADRMFQTNQGPSFPAHQFIIGGTSAPTAASDLFAAENPWGGLDPNRNADRTAPAEETVLLIDPSSNESSKQYPCFEHPTLVDLLDAKHKRVGTSLQARFNDPDHTVSRILAAEVQYSVQRSCTASI